MPDCMRNVLALLKHPAYVSAASQRQKKGDARKASAAEFREETSKKGQQFGGIAVLLRRTS